MTKEKLIEYKMTQTQDMQNVKEIIGEKIRIDRVLISEYTDREGEIHTVAAIRTVDGNYYRSEGGAFIEQLNRFWGVFGAEVEKPLVEITGNRSKGKGNPYVSMKIVEEE